MLQFYGPVHANQIPKQGLEVPMLFLQSQVW